MYGVESSMGGRGVVVGESGSEGKESCVELFVVGTGVAEVGVTS